ncbi:MAG TPA: enoyl-CoA hydratase-related protein [Polyangiales bacterium]
MSSPLPDCHAALHELTHVRYQCADGVAQITLDRPQAANAYSSEMLAGLETVLRHVDADANVRAVVLTGAGKSFCAGGDLHDMAESRGMFAGEPVELLRRYEQGLQRLALAFERLAKPVIAAINGHAIGGGLTLACMCDLRVCSADARLGSTFVKLGLVPADGSTFVLQRTVGFSRALDLMLTGRVLAADEALTIGLVDQVVTADQVLAAARNKAALIAQLPATAVQLTKRACYSSSRLSMEASLELVGGYQAIAQRSQEHKDAVRQFLAAQKR